VADDQVILDLIVKAQDQAKGMLAQQVALLNQMVTGVNHLVAAQQKSAQAAAAAAQSHKNQGDSLDRLIRLHDQYNKQQQRTIRGFEAMNMSLKSGQSVNLAQISWMRDLNKAVQQNSGFMQAHGREWNSVYAQMQRGGQVTPQLLKQFHGLGQAFQQHTQQGQQAASTLQNINVASTAAAAALGAVAGAIVGSLVGALREAVNQASLFQNTFIGLSTSARAFGQDVGQTTEAARVLASDGLMSVRESASGLKNLLMAGFGLPEAIELMKGFKDIAAFNRQASLDFGYAIVSATEGIKNQNSLLVDNAGLTKNLTVILKEMGLSEQDLAKVQTDVNIRTKFYQGLLKEMSVATGDAARLTQTYSGALTGAQVQIQLLQVAIGEQLLPLLTPMINSFKEWVAWLRNSESTGATVVRWITVAGGIFAVLTAAVVGLTAAAAALTGALLLLGPAFTTIGVSAGVFFGLVGGAAAIIAGVASAAILWKSNTASLDETLKNNIDTLKSNSAAITEQRDKLLAMKASGASAVDIYAALQDANIALAGVIPNTKRQFVDLDGTIKILNGTLDENKKKLNEFTLNKVSQDLLQFGATLGEQKDFLNTVRLQLAKYNDELERTRGTSQEGRTREFIAAYQQQERAISSLIEQQRALTDAKKTDADADSNLVKARKGIDDMLRRSNELTKGQITTFKSYQDAAKKLAGDLELLTLTGMDRDAAMRLPEIVKQAKELTTAAREGVAPMDALANAIVKRGEAIERARRLEQEAAEHSREFENRTRALTRTFLDQTVGVDSLALKTSLLTKVMGRVGADFNDSRETLRPFKDLMQDIVDRVEVLGEAAPPQFAKIKAALLEIGGTSHLDEVIAGNFDIIREQASKTAAEIAKINNEVAEQRMEREKWAFDQIQSIRDKTLEAAEVNERDSLAKRERVLRRSFKENTRDLNLSVDADKRVYDAYVKQLEVQIKQLGITWRREYYGPNKQDLRELAAESKKRFVDMQTSGEYTAAQVQEAWEEAYASMQREQESFRKRFRAAMQDSLEEAVKLFEQMANIAGDNAFGGMAKDLATLATSMLMASKGADQLEKGVAAFKDRQTLQGVLNMAAGVMQMVAAFDQATKGGNQFLNMLGGAQVGSQIGESLGSLFGPTGALAGMIGGGIIGGIVGAFRKPQWKKVKDDIKRDLGESVSEGVAQQIADFAKQNNVSRKIAELLNLNTILQDVGGLSAQNYARFTGQATQLLDVVAKGGKNAKKALTELNEYFGSMVERMNTEMNGLADKTMLNFIKRVRESGVQVKAVNDFLLQMADSAGNALNKVVGALVGQAVSNYDKLAELVDTTLPSLLEKQAKLVDELGKEKDPNAILRLQYELKKTEEAIAKAFAEADRLSGGVARFAAEGQAGFDRMGRIIAGTFAAGVASGKSFVGMLLQIQPALDAMRLAAEKFGFTISDSVASLLGMSDFAKNNAALLEGVDAMNELVKSVHNMGAMSQEMFTDFSLSAIQMRDDLVNAGATGGQALAMMQPTLQTLWELQDDFGFKVDETTQKLLDEAEAAGLVGDKHKSATSQMVDGVNKLVDRMERLLTHFGVTFPRDAEAGSGRAEGAVDGVRGSIDDVNRRLDQNGWDDWARDAERAGERAYDATHAVSYGHSPGGLIDIQRRLEELKKQWREMGDAATSVASATVEQQRALADALHNLQRFSMDEFALGLDDVEQRRLKALERFLETMKDASQAMIDQGVAAINSLAALEQQKFIDEFIRKRNERIGENLQGIVDDLQDQAVGSISDPLSRDLATLELERQRRVMDFVKSMEGATQEQITQGLVMLEKLYEQRAADIARRHAESTESTATATTPEALASARREAQGTLAWSMSDTARNGLSAAAVAEALRVAMAGGAFIPTGKLEVLLPFGKRMERITVDLLKDATRDRRFNVGSDNVLQRLD
jgi:hypothetical protein